MSKCTGTSLLHNVAFESAHPLERTCLIYVTLKGHSNVILVDCVLITLSSLIVLHHVSHLVLHSLGSLPALAGLRIASMKI